MPAPCQKGSVEAIKVQEVKRQMRLREWAGQISDCKQSGSTVRQWCEENGIGLKTYYNRMKRVREELLDNIDHAGAAQLSNWIPKQIGTPVFAALPMPRRGGAAVTVQIGAHTAEINNGADAETVEGVLRALSRL